jgi:hypothetical protein
MERLLQHRAAAQRLTYGQDDTPRKVHMDAVAVVVFSRCFAILIKNGCGMGPNVYTARRAVSQHIQWQREWRTDESDDTDNTHGINAMISASSFARTTNKRNGAIMAFFASHPNNHWLKRHHDEDTGGMDRVDHNNAFFDATSICGVVVASAATTMMMMKFHFFSSFFAQSRPHCRQQQLPSSPHNDVDQNNETRTEVHRKLSHPALTRAIIGLKEWL